jgi:hypothetical protein
MRTSLTRLNTIEDFLSGKLSVDERILLEANLLLDKEMATDMRCQDEAYKIIRFCSRQGLKSELEILHRKMLMDPKNKSFWNHVRKIFQKN